MESLNFAFDSAPPATPRSAVLVGVVASGNLEVMIEAAADDPRCRIEVHTAARGFDAVWSAVLRDFFERSQIGGVRISINDVGATPAVVSLRLDQALEEFRRGVR